MKKKLVNLSLDQVTNINRCVFLCVVILLICEIVFSIPSVSKFFSDDIVEYNSGWVLWVIVWLIMFAQVCIVPIPALPILVACEKIPGLASNGTTLADAFSLHTLFYIAFITSASLCGSIAAYWIGRKFGMGAMKKVAGSEDDYNKWSSNFNKRFGKTFYAATVLLPLFPDDLICVIVGAMKMDFKFFFLTNAIGQFLGSYTTQVFLKLPFTSKFIHSSGSGSFPIALVTYCIIIIFNIIFELITRSIKNKESKRL